MNFCNWAEYLEKQAYQKCLQRIKDLLYSPWIEGLSVQEGSRYNKVQGLRQMDVKQDVAVLLT